MHTDALEKSSGGSFLSFAQSSIVGAQSQTEGTQSQTEGIPHIKNHKFYLECEGSYGRLQNKLLDAVLKAFNSDQWWVMGEGKDPGYLWKKPKNLVFYVAEIFFARKFCMCTSDAEAASQIVAATSKSSNFVKVGASATAWGGPVAREAEHSLEKSNKIESSMEKNSKDESVTQVTHGGLYINFLLLKPFIPAPMRSMDTKGEQVDTPEYASTHIPLVQE